MMGRAAVPGAFYEAFAATHARARGAVHDNVEGCCAFAEYWHSNGKKLSPFEKNFKSDSCSILACSIRCRYFFKHLKVIFLHFRKVERFRVPQRRC
jgi:hypothetical protein